MDQSIKLKPRSFEGKILYFNGMYRLAVAPWPTIDTVVTSESKDNRLSNKEALLRRLEGFKKTLIDEINEIDDITANINQNPAVKEIDILTDIADLLGDIQVYCASEMAKFGIPIEDTLHIIMASNFSKLQADGTTLYDSHGKVQKGPHYYKPEPEIKAMLLSYRKEAGVSDE